MGSYSCATELAMLQYSANRIGANCLSAKDLGRPHFENLRRQWQTSPWDLAHTVLHGQVPELHLLTEGFFAGLKSLLDLNSQLISTEGVVGVSLDGFHRKKDVYGGAIVNALNRNAKHEKKRVATAIKELITEHKKLWIDDVIGTRDLLVHPSRGAHQLMFRLQVENRDGLLVYEDAVPPHIEGVQISDYAAARVENVKGFSSSLLTELRKAA